MNKKAAAVLDAWIDEKDEKSKKALVEIANNQGGLIQIKKNE